MAAVPEPWREERKKVEASIHATPGEQAASIPVRTPPPRVGAALGLAALVAAAGAVALFAPGPDADRGLGLGLGSRPTGNPSSGLG